VTVFDLVFIGAFFATVATLFAALIAAIRGRNTQAAAILRRLALCASIYLAVVALVTLIGKRRVLNAGEPRCFDDWCVAVEGVSCRPVRADVSYIVNLRISSRALRVSFRERNAVVYLADDNERRFDPTPDKSGIPLDVFLRPAESVTTSRAFMLPANVHEAGLVVTHEGGFPIDWFIIGYETWFRKPTMIRLQ
jgi:hypothetical protein